MRLTVTRVLIFLLFGLTLCSPWKARDQSRSLSARDPTNELENQSDQDTLADTPARKRQHKISKEKPPKETTPKEKSPPTKPHKSRPHKSRPPNGKPTKGRPHKSTAPKSKSSPGHHPTSGSLKIPPRKGQIQTLSRPRIIKGHQDFQFQEFDRGQKCDLSKEYPTSSAVFILQPGASISNVIIGIDQINAIVCMGSCTLRNVYWRGVCDDALEIHGKGDVLVENCFAQNATNKVIQHDSPPGSTVTIRGGKYVNVEQLYRSCGNCRGNAGPRHVVIEGIEVENIGVDLAGLNRNFKDSATISKCCGTGVKDVCQVYEGAARGLATSNAKSIKDSTSEKSGCLGPQGRLNTLPACRRSMETDNAVAKHDEAHEKKEEAGKNKDDDGKDEVEDDGYDEDEDDGEDEDEDDGNDGGDEGGDRT